MLVSFAGDHKKDYSSSDSHCENVSLEEDFLTGFKSILEIKDSEEPSVQTRCCVCFISQGTGEPTKLGSKKNQVALSDVIDGCHNSCPFHGPSLKPGVGSALNDSACKRTCGPSELFISKFNASRNEQGIATKGKKFYSNSCPKIRKLLIDSTEYLECLRPLPSPHRRLSHEAIVVKFHFKERRVMNSESEQLSSGKPTFDPLIKQVCDENYEFCLDSESSDDAENSIEVIRIFKKDNIKETETLSNQLLNSKGNNSMKEDKVVKPPKAKAGNKHTSLAEDETFFRFDRRGWICVLCLNFNFESKQVKRII